MKCMQHPETGRIVRVKDDKAMELAEKGWAYCPKSEWKAKVRDVGMPLQPNKIVRKFASMAEKRRYEALVKGEAAA